MAFQGWNQIGKRSGHYFMNGQTLSLCKKEQRSANASKTLLLRDIPQNACYSCLKELKKINAQAIGRTSLEQPNLFENV
jgi:hypothetical protein